MVQPCRCRHAVVASGISRRKIAFIAEIYVPASPVGREVAQLLVQLSRRGTTGQDDAEITLLFEARSGQRSDTFVERVDQQEAVVKIVRAWRHT